MVTFTIINIIRLVNFRKSLVTFVSIVNFIGISVRYDRVFIQNVRLFVSNGLKFKFLFCV